MGATSSLRVIFAGTPTFAAQHLQALIDSHHQILAVYTQPDRPAGRGKRLSPSPVKMLALANNILVLQPSTLKSAEAQQQLAVLKADIMVVVAYGLILPQAVLDSPRLGCINVHASLLPRWRGAAPIQRAIEAGDKKTGVTIMQMDAGLDTGPMLLKVGCPITQDDNSDLLLQKLATLGGPALLTVLDQASAGELKPEQQNDELACYANKIDKAEAKINWHLSADVLQRQIRAFNPFPVAFCGLGEQRIKIYNARVIERNHANKPGTIIGTENGEIQIACGENVLSILALQLPGKKALASTDILRGYAALFSTGVQLS